MYDCIPKNAFEKHFPMFGLHGKSQFFLWIKLESWNKWTPTHITNFSWQKESMFKSTGREKIIWFCSLQPSPNSHKLNNPHSLKHSNKHIVSNNSRDKFWEQKSLKFNAPYTNIIKKNYPAQKHGGIEQETKSNMAEQREREPVFRRVVLSGVIINFTVFTSPCQPNIYGLPRVQTVNHHDYFE